MYSKQKHHVSMHIPVDLHALLKAQANLVGQSVHSMLVRGAELALEESRIQHRELLRNDPFVQQLIQEEIQRLSQGVDS